MSNSALNKNQKWNVKLPQSGQKTPHASFELSILTLEDAYFWYGGKTIDPYSAMHKNMSAFMPVCITLQKYDWAISGIFVPEKNCLY